jgi:hypothetical protein
LGAGYCSYYYYSTMSATIKKRGGAAAAAAFSEERPVKVGDSRNNNNGVTVIEARSLDEIKKELLALKSSSTRHRASPVVVVRSSIPDARAKSLLPEGTVVLVPVDFGTKEPAVRSAAAASSNAPPAAKKLKSAHAAAADDDDDTGRHDLVLSRWATMRGVANEQKKNEAIRHSCWSFLAAATVDKPVMSALFRDNDPRYPQNYFQRSAPATPRDQLRSFTYLPLSSPARGDASDVAVTTWTQRDNGGGGPPPALDDKLVLEATFTADPDGAKRQVRRVVLLYDSAVFDRDVVDAFQANYDKALRDTKLEGVDVTVEVLSKPAYVTNVMVIVVTASSTTRRRHDDALQALFPNLLRIGQQSVLLIDPIDIHQMGAPLADRHGAFNLPSRESGGMMKVSAAEGFFSWLKVAALAAASPENPNLQAFFRLAKDDGEIYANVVVFEAEKGVGSVGAAAAPSFTPKA